MIQLNHLAESNLMASRFASQLRSLTLSARQPVFLLPKSKMFRERCCSMPFAFSVLLPLSPNRATVVTELKRQQHNRLSNCSIPCAAQRSPVKVTASASAEKSFGSPASAAGMLFVTPVSVAGRSPVAGTASSYAARSTGRSQRTPHSASGEPNVEITTSNLAGRPLGTPLFVAGKSAGRSPVPPVSAAGRSQGTPGRRKAWKERHEKYCNPFFLDVFISPRYVTAKVVHRVTSRTVAVATTNAKEFRLTLPSLADEAACRLIGREIAKRAMDVDVFAVTFKMRKGEKNEDKVQALVDAMVNEGGMMMI